MAHDQRLSASRESRRRWHIAWLVVLAVLSGAASAAHADTAALATLSPQTIDLGDIQVPGPPATRTVRLTNVSAANVVVAFILPGGRRYDAIACFDAPLNYRVISVLAPGEVCTTELDFASLIPAGSHGPGTVSIEYDFNNGQQTLSLPIRWNAIAPYITFDPADLRLADQQVGTASPYITRTITNNSATPVSLVFDINTDTDGIGDPTGFNPECVAVFNGRILTPLCFEEIDQQQASFMIDSPECHPVAAFGSCTVGIRFAPVAAFAMKVNIRVSVPSDPFVVAAGFDVYATGLPRQTQPSTVLAVEYFNPLLNHYFVTASPLEIAALDRGAFAGWQRSGRSFWVYPTSGPLPAGTTPVCRYYGRPEAGIDSHFYSASPAECAEVATLFGNAWQLESDDVFHVYLPAPLTGACPIGTSPLYRAFNQRADANHRYMTDPDVLTQMANYGGWIREGYGPDAVAMCVPQ